MAGAPDIAMSDIRMCDMAAVGLAIGVPTLMTSAAV